MANLEKQATTLFARERQRFVRRAMQKKKSGDANAQSVLSLVSEDSRHMKCGRWKTCAIERREARGWREREEGERERARV